MLIDNVVFSQNDGYTNANRVIIVGGHFAEDIALTYHFYSCQPGRSFREASYIAFYHKKRIKYVFKIKGNPIQVNSLEEVQDKLPPNYTLTAIDKEPHTFFELEDAEELKEEVCHNDFGPFVQRQRYEGFVKLDYQIYDRYESSENRVFEISEAILKSISTQRVSARRKFL